MLRNNKGFTVIELIMSFLFSSILAISLFSVIVTYRNKQMDSTVEADILSFKAHLIMDIQEDIQLKGLKSMENCPGSEDGKIVPRCVILNFNGNPEVTKRLEVKFDHHVDVIQNDDRSEAQFYYDTPYIEYGGIRYEIPDAANVYIEDDYVLQKTEPSDGIESGNVLYKINFNLKHSDLDTNVNISLVANGTEKVPATGDYKEYGIGNEVYIQLNDHEQRKFRVIQNSNRYNENLVLLYDDVYDASNSCDTTYECNDSNPSNNCNTKLVCELSKYNVIDNVSNRYNGSLIKNKIQSLERRWNNVDRVRLITVDEVSRIAALCPLYRGADSPEITLTLSSSDYWLIDKTYWTMSEKELSGNDNGKKVWYVNGSTSTLAFDYVNQSHTLRPVIEVKKIFVTN